VSDSIRQSVVFPELQKKPVHVGFDEPMTTSDGCALLLKALDDKLGITETIGAYLFDSREPSKIRHTPLDVIRYRVLSLALGYPDANDANRLADDSMHKLLLDRDPVAGDRLPSSNSRHGRPSTGAARR